MKAGDKFCGYTWNSKKYFELELLREPSGDGPWWLVSFKGPDGGHAFSVRMPEWQIKNMLNSFAPENLDNV